VVPQSKGRAARVIQNGLIIVLCGASGLGCLNGRVGPFEPLTAEQRALYEALPDTVRSLPGYTLVPEPLDREEQAKREAAYDEALATWEATPDSENAIIWLGRRHAYLGRFRKSIETYTEGLSALGESPRLLRHRGHRFITVRELDSATRDLTRAAELIRGQPDELEPDGQPNAQNVPLSTLHSNIWYHLGVAEYCRGNWVAALAAFSERVPLATNDDQRVSTAYWRWLCMRRLYRFDDAREVAMSIEPSMTILENESYFAAMLAVREFETGGTPLSLAAPESSAAQHYAMAVAELTREDGNLIAARTRLRWVRVTTNWVGFVCIAAEADEVRLRHQSPATTGRTGGY
jgi:tetratricopeptide (TPR) repeat protein